MKKAITYLLIMTLVARYVDYTFHTVNTYYIRLELGDPLINKIYYKNTIGFTYKCACYAGKNSMKFRCDDSSKNYVKNTLVDNYYSIAEFAHLATKEWDSFKDQHFFQDRIYIIEKINNHKYKYYQVKFYPIEHGE